MIVSTTFDSNRMNSVKDVCRRIHYYRGWDYAHFPDNPVTGQWCATRFGVAMSAGSEEQLQRMIDQRVISEAARVPSTPDLLTENHGSLYLFHPLTENAKDWLKRTAPADAQFLGRAMAVEPRYVQGVVDAAEADGLSVA